MPTTAKRQRKPASRTPVSIRREARQNNPEPVASQTTDSPYNPLHYFNAAETSHTHELVIDAVSTMLSRDSDSRDVDMLLVAAMRHLRRRTLDEVSDDQKYIEVQVDEFVRRDFAEWKADVIGECRKNRRKTGDSVPATKTVTEKIRENARQTLFGSFEGFMASATPEEVRFMEQVLLFWDSRHHSAETKHDEIYIASAFEDELRRNINYLRVPENMVEKVQKYIDALRAFEKTEVA